MTHWEQKFDELDARCNDAVNRLIDGYEAIFARLRQGSVPAKEILTAVPELEPLREELRRAVLAVHLHTRHARE